MVQVNQKNRGPFHGSPITFSLIIISYFLSAPSILGIRDFNVKNLRLEPVAAAVFNTIAFTVSPRGIFFFMTAMIDSRILERAIGTPRFILLTIMSFIIIVTERIMESIFNGVLKGGNSGPIFFGIASLTTRYLLLPPEKWAKFRMTIILITAAIAFSPRDFIEGVFLGVLSAYALEHL